VSELSHLLAMEHLRNARTYLTLLENGGKAVTVKQDLDRLTLAISFRRIGSAATAIADVLRENESLNETVPANWPLGMCAVDFAAECFAMAEHYETPATGV